MSISKILASIILAAVLTLSLVACGNDIDGANETTSTDGTSDVTTTEDAHTPETDNIVIDTVKEVINKMNIENQIKLSHLAIEGEVTAISEPFTVVSTKDGNKRNFFEYDVKVTDIIAGNINIGATIKVRVPGGTVGNIKTTGSVSPKFTVENKYILMLNKATKGTDFYVTDEDYYTIVGVNQGSYLMDDDGLTIKEAPCNKQELKDLAKTVFDSENIDYNSEVTRTNNYFTEELVDGNITKEEYDSSIAALQKFAERVK